MKSRPVDAPSPAAIPEVASVEVVEVLLKHSAAGLMTSRRYGSQPVDALDVLVERGLHAALHRGGCRTAKLVSEAKQDNSPNLGRPRSSPIAGRLLLCASDSASCWRSPGANSGPLSSWTTSKRVTLRVANERSRRAKRWPALAQARRVDVVRGASEICAARASARAVNGEGISSLPHVGNALAHGECDSEGLDPGVPRAAWARPGLDPGKSRGGGEECLGRATGRRNQRCADEDDSCVARPPSQASVNWSSRVRWLARRSVASDRGGLTAGA